MVYKVLCLTFNPMGSLHAWGSGISLRAVPAWVARGAHGAFEAWCSWMTWGAFDRLARLTAPGDHGLEKLGQLVWDGDRDRVEGG